MLEYQFLNIERFKTVWHEYFLIDLAAYQPHKDLHTAQSLLSDVNKT